MPTPIRPTLIALALAAGLAACGGRSEPPAPLEDAPAELRQVPTTSAPLGGFTYRLETYLWRDFMPGPDATAEGRPLIAALNVTVIDDTAAFPAGVTVDRVWVVNGDQVWRAIPREEQPRASSGKVET